MVVLTNLPLVAGLLALLESGVFVLEVAALIGRIFEICERGLNQKKKVLKLC